MVPENHPAIQGTVLLVEFRDKLVLTGVFEGPILVSLQSWRREAAAADGPTGPTSDADDGAGGDARSGAGLEPG